MVSELRPGVQAEHRVLVTSEVAVDFLGVDEARVLGTPFLIGLLEMTARNAIKPHLEEGFDTVGTEVNVKHLAATPLGMQVTFHAEVLEVEGRRVRCKVEAFDEVEKVAEGTHERFIVNVSRFATRLAAKKAGA